MLKYIIILFFLGVSITCYSQNPHHFLLGEKELADYEIYGITQDNERNLWITTDNGIVKYDGYTFKKIPHDKNILTSSFFSPTLNNKGEVFCANLTGEILKVVNDTLRVFFKDPSTKKSIRTYFKFTKNDKLLVASSNVYLVDSSLNKDGYKIIYTFDHDNMMFSYFISLPNNEFVLYFMSDKDEAIYIDSNLTIKKKVKFSSYEIIQGIKVEDSVIYFNSNNRSLLRKKDSVFGFIENEIQINDSKKVTYETDGNLIWVLYNEQGASIYNKNLESLNNTGIIFKNKFISTVFKDKENNTLLGTFNNGIVVIPNINITRIEKDNFHFTHITKVDNRFFASTSNNKIVEFDTTKNYHLLKNTPKKVSYLYGLNDGESLLYYDDDCHLVNLKDNSSKSFSFSGLKDVTFFKDKSYLMTNYKGIFLKQIEKKDYEYFNEIKERTFHINYDTTTKVIYAGTVNGLSIGRKGHIKRFYYKTEPIMVNDIINYNKITYVGSKNNGILVFKGTQLINTWGGENSYKNVKHIRVYNNRLYALTNIGLCVIDCKTGSIIDILTKANGYHFKNVSDIEIWNNELWSVSINEMQIINLNSINSQKYKVAINLNQLKVNDSTLSFSTTKFDFTNTKFEFTFSSPSIKYKDEIFYQFKLKGIDKTWQTNDYTINKALYKSLPSGNYTFQVKTVWRQNESNTANYSFTISPPFWSTWWFYLIIISLFIALTIWVAKFQILKQRKKSRLKAELNLSKLKAIQSQMNPHFIFNSLNSIQDLIIKNKKDKSYDYIVLFSELVRSTLSNSNNDFISIEDEIDFFEVYLKLEKLRFGDEFNYNIITNGISDIYIPSFIIQPFIENALLHGLMHRKGQKSITIEFKLGDELVCIITDNGVGRAEANRIKERRGFGHESFAMNAIKERLKLLGEQFNKTYHYRIEDLLEYDIPMGTRIILTIPFEEEYYND